MRQGAGLLTTMIGSFMLLAGCSPASHKAAYLNLQSSSAPVVLTADAYQKTVYPYVTSVGCATCHANGPTAAVDWFASPSLATAFQTASPKVNVSDPSSSLFAIRVSDNHCGFPSTCGISNSAMLSAIQE